MCIRDSSKSCYYMSNTKTAHAYHSSLYANAYNNSIPTIVLSPPAGDCKGTGSGVMMEILKQRSSSRGTLKSKETEEQLKLMEKWRREANRARAIKTRKHITKLSKAKKAVQEREAEKAVRQIEEKLTRAEERARNLIKSRQNSRINELIKEKLERKEAEVKRMKDLSLETYNSKLMSFERNMHKLNEARALKFQLSDERRDKKTLRSKVQSIISAVLKGSCDKFQKYYERFETILENDREDHPSKIGSLEVKREKHQDLNAALRHSLTKQEIQIVRLSVHLR
eukprot:TRINITY_DN1406_c0_g4_i1.p1 TRINITY_DN1406_c0_g4~~TRINITY_DN1406_c0_g4_i1.p1  ORF type:complete len:283 (-),score=60.57 TRINITY_DN1406_c0_g4_i1:869-1717(-)